MAVNLILRIARGTGQGPTPLAAFDAALRSAGVSDYNLIVLSSVIPPGSVITQGATDQNEDEFGMRLYVVMARADSITTGQAAWAGLGWAQREDGRGLFVEEHGESELGVRSAIRASLGAMIDGRGVAYGPINDAIVGVVCRGTPVCAVAIAVYRSVSWNHE